jgi:hypothetical protein
MSETSWETILNQTPLPSDLLIQYSDMHGYYGGTAYDLHADGTIKLYRMRRGEQEPTVTSASVSAQQVADVIALLVELALWRQQEPERAPSPDESRAICRLSANGVQAQSWEWYNDLPANNRLLRLKEKLGEIFPR